MLANNQKSHLGLVCMVNSFSLAYLECMYPVPDSELEPDVKMLLSENKCPKNSAILNVLRAEIVTCQHRGFIHWKGTWFHPRVVKFMGMM